MSDQDVKPETKPQDGDPKFGVVVLHFPDDEPVWVDGIPIMADGKGVRMVTLRQMGRMQKNGLKAKLLRSEA
jgi:hypothetical protein